MTCKAGSQPAGTFVDAAKELGLVLVRPQEYPKGHPHAGAPSGA